MAGERHGVALWPGLLSVESCTVTFSHGISPAVALLRCSPQSAPIAETGDLVITDGTTNIVIPGCKVDRIDETWDNGGRVMNVTILDRRWKWREMGTVSGWYNQLDPHGKLLPWTIRSPRELAELCLAAMGETTYDLDMPIGLTKSAGQAFSRRLEPGENLAASGTNPPITWEHENPANALQQLCEMFGRRICYRLDTDSLQITPVGVGADLPTVGMSIFRLAPGVDSPETPDGIAVAGAPTRFQTRMFLEAVGRDWDDVYRPINTLSYRPSAVSRVQITECYVEGTVAESQEWILVINGVTFAYDTVSGDDANGIATVLAALINASQDPQVQGVVTAVAAASIVVLTGVQFRAVTVLPSVIGATEDDTRFDRADLQTAHNANHPWGNSPIPTFSNVTTTNRLTRAEAIRLAQETVFRVYRITDVDPGDGLALRIPGYRSAQAPDGRIERREQVVLTPTKVEQIVPQLADKNLTDKLGRPVVRNFYNGLSRDKPAAVYGAVSKYIRTPFVWRNAVGRNTDPDSEVLVPFTIDAENQLVIFSEPVYYADNGLHVEPTLVLETGVMVRNAETNALEVFSLSQNLGLNRGTQFAVVRRPDVQANVIGRYDANNNITRVDLLEADPLVRANYYLQGEKLKYQLRGALTVGYNGLQPIVLDGGIMQVTYSVGEGGAETVASRNMEHATWLPPFPERRRREMLAPAVAASNTMPAKTPAVPYVPGGGF